MENAPPWWEGERKLLPLTSCPLELGWRSEIVANNNPTSKLRYLTEITFTYNILTETVEIQRRAAYMSFLPWGLDGKNTSSIHSFFAHNNLV